MFSEDFTKESESHEIFTKESLQVSYGWGWPWKDFKEMYVYMFISWKRMENLAYL